MSTDTLTSADTLDVKPGDLDGGSIVGHVIAEWHDADGVLFHRDEVHNLITSAGDNFYVARAAALSGAPAAASGMRLGTGTTAVAKTGAGAAIATHLSGSGLAFDSGFPSVSGNVATYKRTYAAGQATSPSAITEAVIVNDTIGTDAASSATNTIARVLLSNPAAKGSGDTLTITWTHTITGS